MDVWERCGAVGPARGGAGGISPRGSPLWVAPRRFHPGRLLGWPGFALRAAYTLFACLPVVQDVWEPCGASRPAQGGAGGISPRGSPLWVTSRPSLPGRLLGPAWDIPVLLSDTAHKLATLIYTMLRYGQEYVDAGAEYHDRSSRWRWLARPVVNSGRRTGRLSHPASAAVVSVPVAAFPFSPGGAARFCFYTCPRPRTGLSGPRLCPRAGGSVPGVSGAVGSPSSGPSGGNPSGPAGPPPAGCAPFCRSRRPAAVLPVFPAGQPFFAAFPPFSAACPPFPPARSPRFPAYPLFGPQSRV